MVLRVVERSVCTIAEAALPAEQFALHETLQRRPDAEFEIVRVIPGGADGPMPFLWASAADGASLPAALDEDPSTEAVELLSQLGEEYLFRVEWAAQPRVVTQIIVEESAAILAAVGRNGAWQFRVLFPDSESFSFPPGIREEYDVGLEFERVFQLSGPVRRGQVGLTEQQYETIVSAYETGYYAVPRGANLEELARQLGVSHQALSERLRRGHETLVANTLWAEIGSRSEGRAPVPDLD